MAIMEQLLLYHIITSNLSIPKTSNLSTCFTPLFHDDLTSYYYSWLFDNLNYISLDTNPTSFEFMSGGMDALILCMPCTCPTVVSLGFTIPVTGGDN